MNLHVHELSLQKVPYSFALLGIAATPPLVASSFNECPAITINNNQFLRMPSSSDANAPR